MARLTEEECKARSREKSARYRAAHPEKVKAASDAWRAAKQEERRLAAAERYAADPAKSIEATKRWQARNRELVNQRAKDYRANHPDKVRAAMAEYRAENKERIAERTRRWQQLNPHKVRVKCQNRRARKRTARGKLSSNLVTMLMQTQFSRCNYCQADLEVTTYHLDHIMPLALGGIHADSNIQLLCPTCNLKKGAKHPDEFRPRNTAAQ